MYSNLSKHMACDIHLFLFYPDMLTLFFRLAVPSLVEFFCPVFVGLTYGFYRKGLLPMK